MEDEVKYETPAEELFSGKILFADGKVNILEVTASTGRQLSEIEQIIKARNVLNKHLQDYEQSRDRRL